ncbi:hypothetical protein PAEPH01_1622 [Pancytospora epiphaga]|nr:hypothetical protein PAEPH01_1622 [Pancytospora epiphaga]
MLFKIISISKINLLRVIIRFFNQFVPGRLELRPRAPALCSGLSSVLSRRLAPRRYSKDMLSSVFYIVLGCLDLGLNKIGYPDVLRVPLVILCYHSVPCHHIRYDPRSAPVFLLKLFYNCICASSLFPPLLVNPDL